ncbi:hypothetical protein GCM10010211_05540 [Streptomyces albospinus]|uniref:Uncharacterized protein n=1 Tax=Streptomyces albospinus TaxID=285515 RepID=A0ABQ2UMC2_9ACTN|nr:hypothetical protein [Streptomyces albospinus]GGU44787.1 hypothetical protein GCM10010211_05540 [Streptomyces albospinus]
MADDATRIPEGYGGWEIRPFEGLTGLVPGGVRLGERRQVLAERFAAAFGDDLGEVRTFRKAPWSTGLSDHYPEGGLILHFDDRERLVHLEAFDPAPVWYDGLPLTGRRYPDVLADLRERGCRLIEDGDGDDGVEAPDAGFHLTAPHGPDDLVDCVGLFRRPLSADPVTMSDEPPVEPVLEHRLVSGEGTEAVRLGQDRWELRGRLGPALQSRPDYGGESQDWYFDHGLVLTFDAADRLASLVISYSGVSGTAVFRGVPLLDRPYAEVVADLAAQGVRVEDGELAGRVPEHGFTLQLVGRQNPAMPVTAVAFG